MFKDSLMRHIYAMSNGEGPKQPIQKTRLGGTMIQNNSKIEDSERRELSMERKFEMMLPYIHVAANSFDYGRLIKHPLIWQNYPNLFNSIFSGIQRNYLS